MQDISTPTRSTHNPTDLFKSAIAKIRQASIGTKNFLDSLDELVNSLQQMHPQPINPSDLIPVSNTYKKIGRLFTTLNQLSRADLQKISHAFDNTSSSADNNRIFSELQTLAAGFIKLSSTLDSIDKMLPNDGVWDHPRQNNRKLQQQLQANMDEVNLLFTQMGSDISTLMGTNNDSFTSEDNSVRKDSKDKQETTENKQGIKRKYEEKPKTVPAFTPLAKASTEQTSAIRPETKTADEKNQIDQAQLAERLKTFEVFLKQMCKAYQVNETADPRINCLVALGQLHNAILVTTERLLSHQLTDSPAKFRNRLHDWQLHARYLGNLQHQFSLLLADTTASTEVMIAPEFREFSIATQQQVTEIINSSIAPLEGQLQLYGLLSQPSFIASSAAPCQWELHDPRLTELQLRFIHTTYDCETAFLAYKQGRLQKSKATTLDDYHTQLISLQNEIQTLTVGGVTHPEVRVVFDFLRLGIKTFLNSIELQLAHPPENDDIYMSTVATLSGSSNSSSSRSSSSSSSSSDSSQLPSETKREVKSASNVADALLFSKFAEFLVAIDDQATINTHEKYPIINTCESVRQKLQQRVQQSSELLLQKQLHTNPEQLIAEIYNWQRAVYNLNLWEKHIYTLLTQATTLKPEISEYFKHVLKKNDKDRYQILSLFHSGLPTSLDILADELKPTHHQQSETEQCQWQMSDPQFAELQEKYFTMSDDYQDALKELNIDRLKTVKLIMKDLDDDIQTQLIAGVKYADMRLALVLLTLGIKSCINNIPSSTPITPRALAGAGPIAFLYVSATKEGFTTNLRLVRKPGMHEKTFLEIEKNIREQFTKLGYTSVQVTTQPPETKVTYQELFTASATPEYEQLMLQQALLQDLEIKNSIPPSDSRLRRLAEHSNISSSNPSSSSSSSSSSSDISNLSKQLQTAIEQVGETSVGTSAFLDRFNKLVNIVREAHSISLALGEFTQIEKMHLAVRTLISTIHQDCMRCRTDISDRFADGSLHITQANQQLKENKKVLGELVSLLEQMNHMLDHINVNTLSKSKDNNQRFIKMINLDIDALTQLSLSLEAPPDTKAIVRKSPAPSVSTQDEKDSELKRAIAMSLEYNQEEELIKRAMAESLKDAKKETPIDDTKLSISTRLLSNSKDTIINESEDENENEEHDEDEEDDENLKAAIAASLKGDEKETSIANKEPFILQTSSPSSSSWNNASIVASTAESLSNFFQTTQLPSTELTPPTLASETSQSERVSTTVPSSGSS